MQRKEFWELDPIGDTYVRFDNVISLMGVPFNKKGSKRNKHYYIFLMDSILILILTGIRATSLQETSANKINA